MYLQALLVIVIADYATGFFASGVEGKLSSRVGWRGIGKKVLIFVMVAVAHKVDQVVGQSEMIRDAVVFFYLWNELLSVLENVGRAGVPVPDVLRQAVDVLKGKGDTKQ